MEKLSICLRNIVGNLKHGLEEKDEKKVVLATAMIERLVLELQEELDQQKEISERYRRIAVDSATKFRTVKQTLEKIRTKRPIFRSFFHRLIKTLDKNPNDMRQVEFFIEDEKKKYITLDHHLSEILERTKEGFDEL